jgi:hypothetical protein
MKMLKLVNESAEVQMKELLDVISENMAKDEKGTRSIDELVKDFEDKQIAYILITENPEVKITYDKVDKKFLVWVDLKGNLDDKMRNRMASLMSFRDACNTFTEKIYLSVELQNLLKTMEEVQEDENINDSEKQERLFKLSLKALPKVNKLDAIEKRIGKHTEF